MTLGHSFDVVLQAAKLGSEWAWASLYGEIAGPLMGYFRCRGVADPESAAADVFFALARDVNRYEGDEETFRVLVFALAHDRLRREQGGRLRSRTKLAEKVLERLQRGASTPPAPTGDLPPHVERAMTSLPAAERDVISLRIAAGLTIEQVADVLGMGVKAVRARQRRGMARLRELAHVGSLSS